DAVPGQPVAIGTEVGADRADEQRAQSQYAEAERDVGGHSTAAYLQVLNEERERHPVELLGDELVDEPAGERHQVVGRYRPGNRCSHGQTRARRSRSAGHTVFAMPSPRGRLSAGRDQWNESPQAQDPVALGLSMVKPCFSIVSTKSMVAPARYGALILSVTTWTPWNSASMSPSISRSSK